MSKADPNVISTKSAIMQACHMREDLETEGAVHSFTSALEKLVSILGTDPAFLTSALRHHSWIAPNLVLFRVARGQGWRYDKAITIAMSCLIMSRHVSE